ncbi:MAG: DUF4251 domain-containing protein [Bacteroidaceae bacterium]|nr:DUF4251 domain-containing protein [Bacteroidaceae bacterium]
MKIRAVFCLFSLCALLFSACATQRQQSHNDIQLNMTVDMHRMRPMQEAWEDLAPQYYLRFEGRQLVSYLPYKWGIRVTNHEVDMNVLNFTAPISGLKHNTTLHGDDCYLFNVQHSAFIFSFEITIDKQGNVSLEIGSDRCYPISFEGTLRQ